MSNSLSNIVAERWSEAATRYLMPTPRHKTATEIAMRAQPSIYDELNRQMQETYYRWATLAANPPVIAMTKDRLTALRIDLATKETPVTTKKQKPEKFNTIGVRFIGGQNPEKIYTYKVRIGAKVHLGQELIADTARGPAAVVVVRTDKTPNQFETYPIEGLKYIEKKAVAL